MKYTCYHIEKGGFTCPIRANKPSDRTSRNLKACPVNGAKPAKMLLYVVNDDHLFFRSLLFRIETVFKMYKQPGNYPGCSGF